MTDRAAVVLALAAAAGAWISAPFPLAVAIAIAGGGLAVRQPVLLIAGVALATSALGAKAWAGLHPPVVGPWSGTATLAGDPAEAQGALRVTVKIAGKRVEAWARGGAAGQLRDRLAGERVRLSGRLQAVPPNVRDLLARRHVGGQMAVSKVEGWFPGDPASRLANGLRRTLGAGVATMPRTARSLYSGFVLGDDREEPPEVADDFKASGLSHLLVVSGENVAFVLALFAPVLSRLGLRSRLLFGLAVLFLFGVLTRWEPSVMRAEAMAAIALIAATAGRPASTLRVLALAVTTVLVIDPLLVGSVGFLLSVGACAGIALLAGPIVRILPGPRPLAAAAAVTIAAQVGVAPILVPVFGGLPVASLPANLLALPAAGPVTIYGIFAGLPAGILGPPVATALHLPTHAMVWWVATVARLSARAPLGQLTLGPLVALAAAAGLAAWARARGSPQVMALGVTGVGAVLVVAALPALRPAGAMGDEVAGGARLWRGGGATLLVVDGAPSPQQLLTSLRTSNVGRLDVLVVVRPGAMAATAIAPVAARYPPRLLLAPEAERLQNAVVPAVGARYNVGEFRITVTSLKPRLAVEVRSARAPPAGP